MPEALTEPPLQLQLTPVSTPPGIATPLLPTLAVNCCEVPASSSAVGGDTPTARTTTVKLVVSVVVNCELGIAGTLAVTLTTLLDGGAETVIGKLALVCPAGIVSGLPPFSTTGIAGALLADSVTVTADCATLASTTWPVSAPSPSSTAAFRPKLRSETGVGGELEGEPALEVAVAAPPQPEGKARSVRRLLVRDALSPGWPRTSPSR